MKNTDKKRSDKILSITDGTLKFKVSVTAAAVTVRGIAYDNTMSKTAEIIIAV